jgi:phosphatidylinositol glycan class B
LIIHLIQAVQAIGYFHPDQHFSIIEFASYKLGFTSADQMAWEFPNKVRPTLQVYLFLGYYYLIDLLNLGDAYTSLTLLRVLVVLLNFVLFNYIILKEFKTSSQTLLIIIILVGNFSWFYPYHKTLFNSENFGAIFYFGSILLYQHFRSKSLKTVHSILVGFLLSLSFYFRFQMGFATIGLGIWFLFYEKLSIKHILALFAGFLIGAGLNTWIDSMYYGDFNFIPYTYWKINIIDGRASGTGTSPFWYYLAILAAVLSAPFLSFIFLYYVFKGLFKKIGNPYVLSTIFFLLFHFLVGHKEERFLFPIFGILPVILGYGIRDLVPRILDGKGYLKFNWGLKIIIGFSLAINFVILFILLTVPYSQPIHFTRQLNQYFSNQKELAKIVCYYRSPYHTGAGNFHAFYWHFKNKSVQILTVEEKEEFEILLRNPAPDTYFAITYDRMINNNLDKMDKQNVRVLASSKKAADLNRWLHENDLFIIPDIWVLYKPASRVNEK